MSPAEDERRKLIEANLPLVWATVRRLGGAWSVEQREEMTSEAMIALVRAVDSFDPSKGAALRTHIIWRVRGAILEWQRKAGPVHRWTEAAIRGGYASARQERRAMLQWQVRDPVSLQTRAHGPTGQPLQDILPASGAALPESCLDGVWLSGPMAALPERMRRILRWSFWHQRNAVEIAVDLGISAARVQQLKHEALRRLRAVMDPGT